VSAVSRRGAVVGALLCLVCGGLASSASAASHKRVFHPRSGNALGMIPPFGHRNFESSEDGLYTPATYHGGQTMTGGVTVHTIFWAPAGHPFNAAVPPGSKAYVPLIQQFLTDLAASSTGTAGGTCTSAACNVFTVQSQYGWGTTPSGITHGDNIVQYSAATDSVTDTNPYPSNGCTSPGDTTVCLTDTQVQREVDRVVQSTPGQPRGLHNIWFVLLPPDVDECDGRDICGTNAFAGYHSLSDVNGHGLTIYGIGIDPLIEIGGYFQGQDPNGNPDAELAIDVVAHEVDEATTDPEGTGWMDPNGFELADKCDVAPNRGNPLGYAPDGSPYNQVLNGHHYLIQEIWSNADHGCVQATTNTSNALPLPQIYLTQFSSTVSGNTENNRAGIHVTVKLVRRGAGERPVTVAKGSGTTTGTGSWTVHLSGGHAVGDDRDQIVVSYSGAQAPRGDLILTGNGGNPFTLSGWTGWTALDQGNALTNHDRTLGGRPSLSIGPCFQTGVLTYSGASGPEPANPFCGSISDVSDVPLSAPVPPSHRVRATSLDNRAFSPPNLPGGGNVNGALVAMTVPVGEADAAPDATGSLAGFTPSGFPACLTDLATGAVGCQGLVPGRHYTLHAGSKVAHAAADLAGTVVVRLGVRRGSTISLSNGARTLTTLHAARLKVHILGSRRTLSGGSCAPGDLWRTPLSNAPVSGLAGEPSVLFGGSALTGVICPANGSAGGLPASEIAQTDDRSGGVTFTRVAELVDISPIEGDTMYGKFLAVAQATDSRSPVSLAIFRAGGHKRVFSAHNVHKNRGAPVRALPTGTYKAVWTVHDRNGDTREYITRFVEERVSSLSRHQHG
jgi:hypothetical protein